MGIQSYGVAPDWAATGDGAYSLPAGKTCIGFYVTGTGSVVFTSLGSDLTVTYADNVFVPCHATEFKAGGTATGVYALLIG